MTLTHRVPVSKFDRRAYAPITPPFESATVARSQKLAGIPAQELKPTPAVAQLVKAAALSPLGRPAPTLTASTFKVAPDALRNALANRESTRALVYGAMMHAGGLADLPSAGFPLERDVAQMSALDSSFQLTTLGAGQVQAAIERDVLQGRPGAEALRFRSALKPLVASFEHASSPRLFHVSYRGDAHTTWSAVVCIDANRGLVRVLKDEVVR